MFLLIAAAAVIQLKGVKGHVLRMIYGKDIDVDAEEGKDREGKMQQQNSYEVIELKVADSA